MLHDTTLSPDAVLNLLQEMNVLCRDDGRHFTDFARLTVIGEKLQNTPYLCTDGSLCRIYSVKPLNEYAGQTVTLVSSHVDCERWITRCFSSRISDELLKGTYDNSITNTAILYLMLQGLLPDNVIVSFTGDEERNSGGALETCRILRKYHISFRAIILDVTDMGWDREANVSMENNFLPADGVWQRQLANCLNACHLRWCFVPSDPTHFPLVIPAENRIHEEAEADESWDYDEEGIECFSFCIPTEGEMHSDEGIYCRMESLMKYILTLESICRLQL